jgi:hypothetical protein
MISNHFVKDMFIKFKYLIDIGCIIENERQALDMNFINSVSKKYGFEKKLITGLKLISDLIGIELQGESKSLSADVLVTPLSEEILLPRLYINEPQFLRRSWQLQDNIIEKIRFLWRCLLYAFLPTYADINELMLPSYLLPILIITRPFRLLYQLFRNKTVKG